MRFARHPPPEAHTHICTAPGPYPPKNATELLSCAQGRPKLIELQASASLPTPIRAEHFAGLQIVRLRALARRRAPKRTSHVAGLQTSPRALAHADSRRGKLRHAPPHLLPTPTRAEEHLAVTLGWRPRAPTPKRAEGV